MNSQKLLVCFYSDVDFLSINILENLLANNCYVNIFSNNTEEWIYKTSHIVSRNKFSINKVNAFRSDVNYSYILITSGFLTGDNLSEGLNFLNQNIRRKDTKIMLILPKDVAGDDRLKDLNYPSNCAVIYVGDLLGPRMDLQNDLKISSRIREMVTLRTLTVSVGEVIYPIFVTDAARQIVKWLFAFGPYGKETLLLGNEVSSSVFWSTNEKLLGQIKYITDTSNSESRLPKIDTFWLTRDVGYSLRETYKWFKQHPPDISKKITPKVKRMPRKVAKPENKYFRPIAIGLVILLLFPIFSVFITGGLTYFSYRSFRNGNTGIALAGFKTAKGFASVAKYESKIAKHIPLLGQVYKETEYVSLGIVSASDMGSKGIPALKIASGLLTKVLDNSSYSVSVESESINSFLQQIYTTAVLFQNETINLSNAGVVSAKYILNKFDFSYYVGLLSQAIVLNNNLPTTLGEYESKTYLLLFQNNMELRPTGGFIGSYGLLTFDKGRLSDFTISDIYSADGQLNGHVEPPSPIKNYLGEANWWFRDSNWDPDFPTSAKRAEWFLDKETDKKVDGVIALDLTPVKDFLTVNGPIYLPDYGVSISKDNFYEKVQSEVQDEFFPGTHTKASFLTALSKSMLAESGFLSSPQKSSLLYSIYKGLNERHLQIFLHDTNSQMAISGLNWDGAVKVPACNNCFSDLVGIVEANVGINKSNYFVDREVDLNVENLGGEIGHALTLTLKNSANENLGVSGNYKSYIRLLIPENSEQISIGSSFGQVSQELDPETSMSKGHLETGALISVLAGETKTITFTWSNKAPANISQYQLLVRKQGGVEAYPLKINIKPYEVIKSSNPQPSLTKDGGNLYNTTLDKDMLIKLSY